MAGLYYFSPCLPDLQTFYDPQTDLLKNGRDVDMDAVDILQIRLRNQTAFTSLADDDNVGYIKQLSLKRRLSQVRHNIRQGLTAIELTAKRSFNRHTGRRDKLSKKCKFCLSKREEPEIVTHHNLFDDNGLVSCPILQEYECELCHATGKYAHTLKYCPKNNPDTPHDIILQARFRVMQRNKLGQ